MTPRFVRQMASLLLVTGAASSWSATEVTAQSSVAASLDRFLRAHQAEIPIPGFSAVVVKDGRVIFAKGYGVEVAGGRRPLTTRSPIAIGSQTKSLTAIAVMRLVERRLVDLDAPVTRYLPWFDTADHRGGEITVRMLLNNTSGLPSIDRGLYSEDTDEAAIEREVRSLSAVPLVRAPGASFEYANENWTVAGAIITAVTGLPYSTALEREVLQPLGMTRSTTALARFPAIGALWGHSAEPHGVRPAGPRFLASAVPAGSELRVSADDMGRFLLMLLAKGRVGGSAFLSERSVAELFVPGSVTTTSMPDLGIIGGKTGYGMGWVINEADGRTVIHHGGDAVVMGSWTMIDTTTKTAASILYGGPALDGYRYPSKVWVVNNLIHLANGQPLSDLGRPKEADPTDNDYELPTALLDRYVGTYLSAEGLKLTVTKAPDGSRLYVAMDAGAIRARYEVDFASEVSAILRNISRSVVTNFLITPAGQVTGLAGGIPGGVFRRRGADEMARIQEARSPNGLIQIQLPRGWLVRWTDGGFEARHPVDSTIVVSGGFAAAAPRDEGVRVISETVGRYQWVRRSWTDSTRQRTRAVTTVAGRAFEVEAATRPGRLTGLLRDVVVPLLTTIEFGSNWSP